MLNTFLIHLSATNSSTPWIPSYYLNSRSNLLAPSPLHLVPWRHHNHQPGLYVVSEIHHKPHALAIRSATRDVQVKFTHIQISSQLQFGCTVGTEAPLAISCSRCSDHRNNNIIWRPGLCVRWTSSLEQSSIIHQSHKKLLRVTLLWEKWWTVKMTYFLIQFSKLFSYFQHQRDSKHWRGTTESFVFEEISTGIGFEGCGRKELYNCGADR